MWDTTFFLYSRLPFIRLFFISLAEYHFYGFKLPFPESSLARFWKHHLLLSVCLLFLFFCNDFWCVLHDLVLVSTWWWQEPGWFTLIRCWSVTGVRFVPDVKLCNWLWRLFRVGLAMPHWPVYCSESCTTWKKSEKIYSRKTVWVRDAEEDERKDSVCSVWKDWNCNSSCVGLSSLYKVYYFLV